MKKIYSLIIILVSIVSICSYDYENIIRPFDKAFLKYFELDYYEYGDNLWGEYSLKHPMMVRLLNNIFEKMKYEFQSNIINQITLNGLELDIFDIQYFIKENYPEFVFNSISSEGLSVEISKIGFNSNDIPFKFSTNVVYQFDAISKQADISFSFLPTFPDIIKKGIKEKLLKYDEQIEKYRFRKKLSFRMLIIDCLLIPFVFYLDRASPDDKDNNIDLKITVTIISLPYALGFTYLYFKSASVEKKIKRWKEEYIEKIKRYEELTQDFFL